MVWLTDARAPEGMRLYAIGDVHGCLDALTEVHRDIEADLAARPVDDWRVIHLGDYVDRGPDSRGVIDFLLGRADEQRMIFLRGNHDQMFVGGMVGDRQLSQVWLNNGGVETLLSYGLDLMDFMEGLRSGNPLQGSVPDAHRAFLDNLQQSVAFGDYYFVHAGIDPKLPLADQSVEAQLWIRDEFLASGAEYEAVVVHGHTPEPQVALAPNRIGIDTGAVYGGALCCLVLEGGAAGQLTGSEIEPLPMPEVPGALEYGRGGRGPGVLGRMLRGLGRRG